MPDCIFCKIINGEIPGKFIYRDSEIVAFKDINPKAPVHVLVVPIRHIRSLQEVESTDEKLLGNLMLKTSMIAGKLKIAESGFKIVINNGESSGQIVFHLHLHLLGGWGDDPQWEV